MKAAGCIASLAVLFSCADDPTSVNVVVPEEDGVSFLVFFDDADTMRRIGPPVSLDDGEQVRRQRYVLEDGESSAVLVRLERDLLRRAFSGYEASRAAEFTVEAEAPPSTPILEADLRTLEATRAARVPEDTTLSSVEGDGPPTRLAGDDPRRAAIMAGVTLRAPVDPEYCRSEHAQPLGAYAAATNPFGRYIADVAPIADDRVIVATNRRLSVIERRGDVVTSVGMETITPTAAINNFRGVATRVLPDGRLRIVAIANALRPGPELGDSDLFEFSLDEDVLRYDRTLRHEKNARYRDVAMDAEGRLAIVGDDGVFLFESSVGGAVERRAIERVTAEEDAARRIEATLNPDRPWFFSTRGRTHFYDRTTDTIIDSILDNENAWSLHLEALTVPTGGASTYWAAGTSGGLYRFDGVTWERIELALPPRFRDCAPDGPVAAPVIVDAFLGLAQFGQHVFASVDGCSALLTVDVATHCTAVLLKGNETTPMRGTTGLRRMLVVNGELVVASEDGALYSTPLVAPEAP